MSRDFRPVYTPPPAASGPPAWIIGLAVVGLVAVVGVGAWILFNQGAAPGVSPSARPTPTTVAASPTSAATPTGAPATGAPSPTAEPSPTVPPASATPSTSGEPIVTPDPELSAQIDAVVADVPEFRELQPLRDVPYSFIGREDFREDLLDLLAEDDGLERLAVEERVLMRLGLLPADADLEDLVIELYGSQIAAFYRPDTGAFYVIERDAPFAALDRIVVAHEYTHALQDQHFDLEANRITDPGEGDAALAQLAVIEGDATLASFQWASQNLSFQEWIEMFNESLTAADQQVLERMPPILRRQLEFPYSEGFAFVSDLHTNGGWPLIDQAIRQPPASTEQILHPPKFYDQEAPIVVDPPALPAALGDGWTQASSQTMGELNMQVLVAGDEAPRPIAGLPSIWPHAAVAAGWGGDRMAMYEHDDGRWVIAWTTAWDTQSDADEFAGRLDDLTARFAGPATIEAITQRPATVQIRIASDQDTLDLLSGP